ncbi:protein shifted-like isoform X3 [Daphnia pulex]|uniref:protein shifted-like isoform X3 n=1 Tax=Daphnia pulex TaxID=6669 RepID=UPI001EE088B5|nr:protein shifted-like isoform X3 [Daphnia pulex]
MTRVVASPLPPSIITTVATGLLLLALGVDLPDGLRRPICSASAPVTTASVRLRHHSSTTVKTSSIIAADVTAAGNQSSSLVAHNNNNNNNNNGATKRGGRMERRNRQQQQDKDDLSLWIDQQQVKMFSGFPMEIYIAAEGRVLSYILDPNFEKYLPVIPSEVGYVNFTWKSGEHKKYYYHFDRLQSFNEDILQPPTVSVEIRGRVPRKPKVFSVLLPCSGNSSGVASFSIGLLIESHKGKPLPGTPLRLRLRKECAERVTQVSDGGGAFRPAAGAPHQHHHHHHHLVPSPHASTSSASAWPPLSSLPDPNLLVTHGQTGRLAASNSAASNVNRSRLAFTGLRHVGPDPECDKKCANGGWCNHEKICQCLEGYMGQHCRTALCYPQCMNGGSCTSPGMCSCPSGFQGHHCEGGICKDKCLNGGKCIQKDTCDCPKGFYGLRCEFTKCVIPCLNGGRCKGVNKCRCSPGFKGDHCEVTPPGRLAQRHLCQRPCRHGTCVGQNRCLCHEGWHGKLCHRNRQHNSTEERSITRRRKVWV